MLDKAKVSKERYPTKEMQKRTTTARKYADAWPSDLMMVFLSLCYLVWGLCFNLE